MNARDAGDILMWHYRARDPLGQRPAPDVSVLTGLKIAKKMVFDPSRPGELFVVWNPGDEQDHRGSLVIPQSPDGTSRTEAAILGYLIQFALEGPRDRNAA